MNNQIIVQKSEKPILFNGEMVRALLDGRKTQTRRIVKLPHNNQLGSWKRTSIGGENGARTVTGETIPLQDAIWHTHTGHCLICPFGAVDDRLWVRETHLTVCKMDDRGMFITDEDGEYIPETWYRADGIDYQYFDGTSDFPVENIPWKPSIHMPRWASRILLEITDIRVERLQNISEEDARAEGCDNSKSESAISVGWHEKPKKAFRRVWEGTGGDWDANPWVWAISFNRVQP